ncbi:MAG TPA: glycosyltransferase family 4 protein [Solirubrobacterales bacterium]|nr:glycosyltransferase family 4 protein [Solirubrobacterales bacterium]
MTAARAPQVVLACDFFLRYTSLLAGGLARAGAGVTLLSRDHELEFGGRTGAAAAFVDAAVTADVKRRLLPGRVRSPRGAAAALRTRAAIGREAPDFVHLQAGIGNDPRLVLASRARRGRFALTIHDPVRHPGESTSRSARVGNRLLVRTAGLIFVHAEALRDELLEAVHPRAPVVVVPHGVEPAATQPLPPRPRILFFGRLDHYKGLDVLLDAMDEVWKAVPEAGLTVAGAGELDDHPALGDRRVTARVEHIPDREVPDLFAAATCVALPYRQASQSGVGSLAKRYGRPLVVTRLGGLPELVDDGSGLTVSPQHPAELAEALIAVLTDRALAERMGAAGARAAEDRSGWTAVAEATLRAYEEHLPRRAGRG